MKPFDALWKADQSVRDNVISIFYHYIPYRWNLFSRKHKENIEQADKIVKDLQTDHFNGDADWGIYQYLITVRNEFGPKIQNVNGEFNSKLNYVITKLETENEAVKNKIIEAEQRKRLTDSYAGYYLYLLSMNKSSNSSNLSATTHRFKF